MYNYVAETVAVLFGAGDEVRTRDIYLGKVMLYQLSYSRIKILVESTKSFGPIRNIWLPGLYSSALFV